MPGSRGGTGGPDPPPSPWDLSEVGSCVDIWWVLEGVQRLFLSYLYFFLARSARQYSNIVNIWKIRITSKFKGWSLLPSYTLSLAFMKVLYQCLFCLKLHNFIPFKPNIFWGMTSITPPPLVTSLEHFTKLKQSSRMCFTWRENAGCHIIKSIIQSMRPRTAASPSIQSVSHITSRHGDNPPWRYVRHALYARRSRRTGSHRLYI